MSAEVKAILTLFLGFTSPAFAEVFTYEAEVLPLDGGWTLIQSFCDPGEWIDSGRLVHTMDFCPKFRDPVGMQIDYTRDLQEFLGDERFFAEWRLETTGDRDEIPFVAPADVTLFNGGSVDYGFTIAADQVKLNRDNSLPITFVDVAPGVPHTYRLEVDATPNTYTWWIDGVVADSGTAEGPLTSGQPGVNIRSKAKFVESVTTWYFIRMGERPEDASADFNSDGVVDLLDTFYIDECIQRSAAGEPATPSCMWADIDGNNTVTCDDWDTIVQTFWTGPSDPPELPACTVDLNPIPTVSNWGAIAMTLLTLTGGSLIFHNSRRRTSPVGAE